jgi:TP901 family phage tail tape measure protein
MFNEETEELDDDLVNIKNDISEFTNGKISIMEDEDTYKSTYQILSDISDIWDELSDKQQAGLTEKLFGKTRANIGTAIITNFQAAKNAMDEMAQSAGDADKELDVIKGSLEYKINNLKETFTGIWQNLIDRGELGAVIDDFSSVMGVIDALTDKLGGLGTLAVGGGLFAIFKNFGKHIALDGCESIVA